MTTAVLFDNVSRHFGAVRAVDGVNLEIAEGEFFAMLGPSGSGKTTCLRLMAGFEQPTGGHIEIFGETAEGVPPYRRSVNTVFQDYALFPHLSILDNVAYGLMVKGVGREGRRKAAEDALAMVKLPGYGTRRPGQLSGGQRQRVALARALANRPKVLLLDEPLGALDKKLREETQFELMDLQQELGLTFVVVTHDQEEAMTMADRIAVMSHGKVIQVATPAEIYEAPNSRFVADFIGDVNIFEGAVSGAEGGYVRLEGANGFPIRMASPERPATGTRSAVAVRPEKIRVSRQPPANAPVNAVQGEIWDIGYLGDMTVFHVRLKDGRVIKASSLNAVRPVEDPLGYDQEVWVSFGADAGVVLKD